MKRKGTERTGLHRDHAQGQRIV